MAIFDPDLELVAEIPEGLPSLGVPSGIDASTWITLLLGGCVVALVGLSEGWGASQALAVETHDDLDTNQEFRALGASNLGAGLMGGMVVTGSLGKSSAAEAAGAKSQMSNILLAGIVLLTLAFFAPVFQWLPAAVLAAIVINAMWESAGPQKLIAIWHVDKVDFALGITTFIVVLVFNLLPAMVTGIVLSIIYTVYRISFPGRVVLGRVPETGDFVVKDWLYGHRSGHANPDAEIVPGVIVYRFAAPLIFSNAEAFKASGKTLLIDAGAAGDLPHTLVVDFEEVYRVDASGAAAVKSLFHYAERYDVELVLARVHAGTHALLRLAGAVDEIGEHRFYSTVRGAVNAATTSASAGDDE